ncbi:MAG: pseudouridine synthase family protein [Opitutales bacterium]
MASSGKLPLGPGVRLLTSHPAGLWALEKAAGVRSHPNDDRPDPRALLTVAYDRKAQCYRAGERAWYLLHRLDAPTSGVILLADNAALAELARAAFAARAVEKTYLAVVQGKAPRREDFWKDRLQTERGRGGARTRTGGGEVALCAMKSLRLSRGQPLLSLLELSPKTGRTHQLRTQCAARQLPIVGDATYGDFRFNRDFAARTGEKRLFLHAHRVILPFEHAGRRVTFRAESPLPATFEAPFG